MTTAIPSYVEHGWSLIPIRSNDKRPIGQWADAQRTRAVPQQVDAWMEEELNLAVVTGELSGVVVVDCDSEAGVVAANKLGMPVTPTATTGNGRHYFLKHPGRAVPNAVRIAEDVDVRGDGGYVLVEPSIHPNGQPYRWVTGLSLEDVPLAECPAWLLGRTGSAQTARPAGEWTAAFGRTVKWGEQNDTCVRLSGYLLRRYVEPGVVHELMQLWAASRCDPPLPPSEVSQVVRSIAAREARRRG